jgi:hypothetical protein
MEISEVTRICWVYALVDPAGEVRYVGKGRDPIKRLRDHLRDRRKSHKASWIASLRAAGQRPAVLLLRACASDREAYAREKELIAAFRDRGAVLTNMTAGGEGLTNPSPAVRATLGAKFSAALRGRKHSADHSAAIAKALRGRPHSPDRRASLRHAMNRPDVIASRARVFSTP